MAVKPYGDVLLERKHHLALKYGQGYAFGQIRDFEDSSMTFRRINSIATLTGQITIGSNTDAYLSIVDTNNNDYFIESFTDRVAQSFIGIYPPRLRMFRQIPAPIIR